MSTVLDSFKTLRTNFIVMIFFMCILSSLLVYLFVYTFILKLFISKFVNNFIFLARSAKVAERAICFTDRNFYLFFSFFLMISRRQII